MTLTACVRAQITAEVRMRLRAPGTVVAALAILALSFLWIPDPASNAVSISWDTLDGRRQTGLYTSAYLGTVSGALAALFLSLIGFYLVFGSVRRDRDSGVGGILAATPISRSAYLLGKLAAHVVYLHLLSLAALLSGLAVFLRYGVGPLRPWDFLAPFILFVPPSLVFTAALALLFDATPGLRGRGGPVVYFFAWSFLLLLVPIALHGGVERKTRYPGPILFDPPGGATLMVAIENQGPDVKPGTASIGLEYTREPIERVEWRIGYVTAGLALERAVSLLWSALPLGLAVLRFDRFDPARSRPHAARPGPLSRLSVRVLEATPSAASGAAAARGYQGVPAAPGAWSAITAEARLVWLTASWLRWPLLLSALGAAVLPGQATRLAAAAFLLLLGPVLSEVAAREELSGASALVASQPAVPRSLLLWKAGAALLFVLLLGLPAALRAALHSPARGVAFATGLAFVAALAVALGFLSRGGKLFSGVYTAHWYLAVNGAGPLDYCGVFGGGLGMGTRAAYLAAALGALALARLAETRRAAG